MPTLIDSSVFIAAARPREQLHDAAVAALKEHAEGGLATPVTILAETMSFIQARLGVEQQRRFWDAFLVSGTEVLAVDAEAIALARDIDRRYADAGYGFADCTLLAACEQLRSPRILSFDRRLAAFKPSFARGLDVLP